MARKNSLQDSLNTLKPIFYFWNSLFQIVLDNITEIWTRIIEIVSIFKTKLVREKDML